MPSGIANDQGNVVAGYWEHGSRDGPGVLCGVLSNGTLVPVVACTCHEGKIHEYKRFEGTFDRHKHIMESAAIELQKGISAARTAKALTGSRNNAAPRERGEDSE